MSTEEEHKEEGSVMEEDPLANGEYPEARQADNWNKDVNETGRWGTRSRKEVLLVGGSVIAVIVAVVLGILFGIVLKGEEMESAGDGVVTGATKIVDGERVSAFELPQPPVPTYFVSQDEELKFLITELSKEPLLKSYVQDIPTSPAKLEGIHEDPVINSYIRAASWLVTVDPWNVKEDTVTRYALAIMYYETNGSEWTNSQNWLAADQRHCDWYGVGCCDGVLRASFFCEPHDFYDVIEVDLYHNNLSGPIPKSVVLLKRLASLYMSNNNLTGEIPAVFGKLTNFTKLYLQHNSLSGTIPDDLDEDNKLGA
jgi:hypothetical protein